MRKCSNSTNSMFEEQEAAINPGEMSGRVFGLEQRVYRPSWRKEA